MFYTAPHSGCDYFALSKLCGAYSSQRISPKLYRHQRALLIDYAADTKQPFPDLILNEYSQPLDIQFKPEVTPVVDDLGFTEESVWQEIPIVSTMLPQLEKCDEHEQEGPFQSTFDRFYWVYLIVFMIAIAVFVATRV